MKKSTKRWLSLALTLVMLLGMVPAFAPAAKAADSAISISGSSNASGTHWSYVASTHTLTLDGYNYSGSSDGITFSGSNYLTINLEGSNAITTTRSGGHGIYFAMSNVTLTVTGNGSLDTKATGTDSAGIYSQGHMEFAGGTLNFYGTLTGIYNHDHNVTISGATVYASGGGGVYIKNGGKLYINSGKLVAVGNKQAIENATSNSYTINSIAGTGWTNTDGTEGETAIPISTEGQILTYKKVQFPGVTYTVSFNSDGGSAVESQTVSSGSTATQPAAPTKTGYTFNGWTLNGTTYDFNTAVTNDITLTADWTINKYTVTWQNEDSTVLETDKNVAYGTTPSYDGATPTKTATDQYTYTFKGWDKEIVAVTGDVTYTAQFDSALNEYTITWKNEDGTVIDTTTVAYGEIPTHADPTKEADDHYTYEFTGWNPAVAAVTGNAEYKATYSRMVNQYTVTFVDEDGETVLKEATQYDYGTAAEDIVKPADPTKEATAQYTYTFAGWEPAVAAVTGDATYKAKFNALRNYTVTFNPDNGENTFTQIVVEDGCVGQPEDPIKDGYGFTGWYNGETEFDFSTEITSDLTLTAHWAKLLTEDMIELSDTAFDYDGDAKKPDVTVTDGDLTLLEDDFTVEYANNVNPGTATVTVTGIGDYTGTVTLTYDIKVVITAIVGDAEETSSHAYKSTVTLDANEISDAPEGKVFSCWKQNDANGKVLSKNAILSFIARKNMTLYAVYEDQDVALEPEAVTAITSVNKAISVSDKNAIEFVYSRSVPQGWKVTGQGLYYATNKLLGTNVYKDTSLLDSTNPVSSKNYTKDDIKDMLIEGSSVKKNVGTSTARNGTTSFKYTVSANTYAYVYAMAYVTGTKTDGTSFTVYSDVEVVTYNSIS